MVVILKLKSFPVFCCTGYLQKFKYLRFKVAFKLLLSFLREGHALQDNISLNLPWRYSCWPRRCQNDLMIYLCGAWQTIVQIVA